MHVIGESLSDTRVSAPQAVSVGWSFSTRLAFRFCVAYLTLYVLATQMLTSLLVLPGVQLPELAALPPFRNLIFWVANEVFGFSLPLVIASGSGDKPFDWTLVFCLLLIAAAIVLVWSIVDRKRTSYRTLHEWFRLFLRFALGSTLVGYGMAKVIPLQMPFPGLTRLLEPYGHFSLMGVLWAQVGASPPYEVVTGSVETVAGVLLFLPGLTLLGALTAFVAITTVFVLNMTYDVPVKLFSFQLVVMSVVLIAPDFRRLMNVIVLNRTADPSNRVPLFRGLRARRVAVAVQCAFAAWLIYSNVTDSLQSRATYGSAPKPSLYGIWEVETMAINGMLRSPLITDYDRWRRLAIQRTTAMTFQRMDDTFASYGTKVDDAAKSIALTSVSTPGPNATPAPAGRLTFERPSPNRLILDGEMDGRKVRMELRLVDLSGFRLLQSRFRWVQDYPFNR